MIASILTETSTLTT